LEMLMLEEGALEVHDLRTSHPGHGHSRVRVRVSQLAIAWRSNHVIATQ